MTEWIEYGKSWKDFQDEGLNQPGAVIELEDGTVYLIGDINMNGGLCDCCRGIKHNHLVVRYRATYES
jgi:hypothetical protein